MRLIDANELTEMVWRERVDSRERIAELIARQPTIKAPMADVKSVKRGKWILFDKDCCGRAFYCSNCRKVTTTDDFENTPLEREEYFCPRCGTDMRGEDNG